MRVTKLFVELLAPKANRKVLTGYFYYWFGNLLSQEDNPNMFTNDLAFL